MHKDTCVYVQLNGEKSVTQNNKLYTSTPTDREKCAQLFLMIAVRLVSYLLLLTLVEISKYNKRDRNKFHVIYSYTIVDFPCTFECTHTDLCRCSCHCIVYLNSVFYLK